MTVQGATLASMNRTEPRPLAEALESMRERLQRMGLDPALVDGDTPPPPARETPEDARERKRQQALNRAARWRERLPVMYLEASLSDLDDDQHAVDVRGWLASGRTGLVLAGPVGTGKTHAAYAIGNAAVDRGLFVEAWTMHDLLTALRPDGDPAAQAFARTADVLILDDLMASKAVTPWAAEALTALMDARLRDRRRTIVTTNAPANVLGEAWGARCMDRLTYRAQTLVLQGDSRRALAW